MVELGKSGVVGDGGNRDDHAELGRFFSTSRALNTSIRGYSVAFLIQLAPDR